MKLNSDKYVFWNTWVSRVLLFVQLLLVIWRRGDMNVLTLIPVIIVVILTMILAYLAKNYNKYFRDYGD